MKRTSLMFCGALLVVGLAACGGRTMKAFTPSESEKEQASLVATKAMELQELKTSAGREQAQMKVQEISNASQSLFSNQTARNAGAGASIPGMLTASLSKAVTGAITGECVTETESRTTYTNCGDGDTTTNGFVDMTGDTFSIDLTIVTASDESNGEIVYRGSITTTPTLVNGSLSFKIVSSASGTSLNYDITTTYGSVALVEGCPTSGTLDVDGSYSATYAGISSGNQSAAVSVTFGPSCGEMSMTGG